MCVYVDVSVKSWMNIWRSFIVVNTQTQSPFRNYSFIEVVFEKKSIALFVQQQKNGFFALRFCFTFLENKSKSFREKNLVSFQIPRHLFRHKYNFFWFRDIISITWYCSRWKWICIAALRVDRLIESVRLLNWKLHAFMVHGQGMASKKKKKEREMGNN